MSESRIKQLSRQLEDLTRNADTVGRKFAAHMNLHSAAVLECDREQMSEHRRSLHVILDRLLDNAEKVQECSDELQKLCKLP